MVWFKVIPLSIVEVLLVLNVQTIPFSNNDETNKVFKRDVENVVSSSSIKIIPPEKIQKLKELAKLKNSPMKFRWSNDTSFMEDLEEMFASIEREIDEMLNNTKTKLSEGFGLNDEFFSFSFFDSDSDSESEEQTAAPEAAE